MPSKWFLNGLAAVGRGLVRSLPALTTTTAVLLDLLLLLAGLAVIVWGIWEFSPAAARIVAGSAMVLLATLPLRRRP
jgi:hypothetical protein